MGPETEQETRSEEYEGEQELGEDSLDGSSAEDMFSKPTEDLESLTLPSEPEQSATIPAETIVEYAEGVEGLHCEGVKVTASPEDIEVLNDVMEGVFSSIPEDLSTITPEGVEAIMADGREALASANINNSDFLDTAAETFGSPAFGRLMEVHGLAVNSTDLIDEGASPIQRVVARCQFEGIHNPVTYHEAGIVNQFVGGQVSAYTGQARVIANENFAPGGDIPMAEVLTEFHGTLANENAHLRWNQNGYGELAEGIDFSGVSRYGVPGGEIEPIHIDEFISDSDNLAVDSGDIERRIGHGIALFNGEMDASHGYALTANFALQDTMAAIGVDEAQFQRILEEAGDNTTFGEQAAHVMTYLAPEDVALINQQHASQAQKFEETIALRGVVTSLFPSSAQTRE